MNTDVKQKDEFGQVSRCLSICYNQYPNLACKLMRILLIKEKRGYRQNHQATHLTQKVYMKASDLSASGGLVQNLGNN
jgi:hypothetical protein